MIRVIVVDLNRLFRSTMLAALRAAGDIEIEAELGDTQEALWRAIDSNPDIFLFGVNVVEEKHLTLLEQILSQVPGCRVILAAHSAADWAVLKAFRIGIRGYVKKDTQRIGELMEAIRIVNRGGSIIDPHLTALIFDEIHRSERPLGIAKTGCR